MTTTKSKPRYSLNEAAKLADMAPRVLARQIKTGQVPYCYYEGSRYYIWKEHFDRHIGIAPPEPEGNSLIRKVVFKDPSEAT